MSNPENIKRTLQTTTDHENYHAAAGSSTTGSSTTTVQVFPGNGSEVVKQYALEQLKQLHIEYFGRPMPSPISAEVLRDLYAGTPSAYYRYAMMEAVYAPRPSWRYVAAIVKRCKTQLIEPGDLPV